MTPLAETRLSAELPPVAERPPAAAPAGRKPFQIPSLDGLRAVSFFVVFLGHAFAKRWIPGALGLIVFFFLSGYLITTLLRLEFDETGRINFRDFYLRRVLRIFPPLYLVLGLDCLLTLTHVLPNTLWFRAVLAQACHLTNYWIVFHGWWSGMAPGSWIFWSLAVEEHFYLVFPLVYLGMRRRRLPPKQQALALLGLCAAVLAWRCVLVFGFHALKDRIYVATDTRVDSILFGCILAVWGNPALDPSFAWERRLKSLWLPLAFCALAASFVVPKIWPGFEQTFRYTVQGVALFPVFIAAVRFPNWGAFRWLNVGWVRTVGLLSYSLYLLHTSVLYGLHHWLRGSDALLAVPALAVSLALAALIYQGVEKPCGRLRRRLSHVLAGRTAPKRSLQAEGDSPRGSARVARNVLVTLGTQLLSWALTFAVTLSLPRYVGDAGLGKMAFAVSLAALFGTVIPLGTSTVLVREIARDRSRTGELLLAAIFLRVPLGLLMTGLLIGTISALHAVSPAHYSVLTRTLVIIAALGMVVVTLNDALASALQGQENLTRQNAAVLTEKFLSSALVIGLIALHQPIWMLASVALFTALASLTINVSAFRPLLPTLRLPRTETLRLLVLAGLPFFALGVFRMIYNQVDVPLLAFFTDDRTVGWYNVAIRLLGSTLFIPVALATALLPSLTRMHAESPERFLSALRRAMALVILCAMPIAVPLVVLPRKILLGFLHYPPAFAHSAPILAIYGVGVLLWYVSQITGTGLVVLDKQKEMCRISVIALVLTVGGCLALIPFASHAWHNGGIGAALTDVSVEVYMNAAFLLALPRGTFDAKTVQVFGRSVLAVAPMAALMLLLHGAWQWAGAAAGVLVYAALCYKLGCLSREDLGTLRQAFARKG